MIEKVISGAQTGADRGGLLAAKALGIPTGGWCPRGRLAEDGVIPAEFNTLQETLTPDYPTRTEWNVRDSDATVLFTWGIRLTPGSRLTENLAKRYDKPISRFDIKDADEDGVATIIKVFLEHVDAKVVNIAGSRESKAPGIQAKVERILRLALAKPERNEVE